MSASDSPDPIHCYGVVADDEVGYWFSSLAEAEESALQDGFGALVVRYVGRVRERTEQYLDLVFKDPRDPRDEEKVKALKAAEKAERERLANMALHLSDGGGI